MKHNHLGTAKELCWFAMEMAEQLELHQKEKESLRAWDFEDVVYLCCDEIIKRGKLILNENTREERIKQSIHIANYAMMIFLRGKYNV